MFCRMNLFKPKRPYMWMFWNSLSQPVQQFSESLKLMCQSRSAGSWFSSLRRVKGAFVCVCVRVCVLEVMKKMLNKVWQCIYVIGYGRVSWLSLFCTPLLSLSLCIIYALWAHIRCRCFINNVFHCIILCFILLQGVLEIILSVTGSHALIKKRLNKSDHVSQQRHRTRLLKHGSEVFTTTPSL